ncbi:TauD/TfdA family dioxygenase [Streptomyces sp. NPDC001142]
MLSSSEREGLAQAAMRIIPAFASPPADPIRIAEPSDLVDRPLRQVVSRYSSHGYALVELTQSSVNMRVHQQLCKQLSLDEPFVPPLYSMGGRAPSPISTISAVSNAKMEDAAHPSFGKRVGNALHCDGTLQPIGCVKATVMSCRTPAAKGGVNTLFDSVAVFADLLRVDDAAAMALARPDVLVRKANINGCEDEQEGPVITLIDGRLVGRYSVTATDSWRFPEGDCGDDLRRAVEYLEAAAQPGEPHFRTVRLEANQIIVFDNTRISHGRTAYTNSEESQRWMYRSLHLLHPVCVEQHGGSELGARGGGEW